MNYRTPWTKIKGWPSRRLWRRRWIFTVLCAAIGGFVWSMLHIIGWQMNGLITLLLSAFLGFFTYRMGAADMLEIWRTGGDLEEAHHLEVDRAISEAKEQRVIH